MDKVATILSWSGEAHGSSWVHRQALCYLREEFQAVSSAPALYELQRKHLLQAIRSDFLQVCNVSLVNRNIVHPIVAFYADFSEL